MQPRLRWGILSTARIGREKVIPGMLKAPNVAVVAMGSRDPLRARPVADSLRIPTVHGSYQALLDDPEVDAIYNPLPNHLHVEWSLRALEAGKHVLVEKPMGLDAVEGERLLRAAAARPHLKVMEAFMVRFHPQWARAQALLDEGAIGRLQTVHAHFSYAKFDPDNIRNRAEMGGGGLLDIGCYNVLFARTMFGREPQRVVASIDVDPTFGTDRLVSGLLEFGPGQTATLSCGTQMQLHQRAQLFGSEGRIELELPYNAPQDGPCRLWHQNDAGTFAAHFDRTDQYALMVEAFSRSALEGTPVPLPLSDGLSNLKVLDALRESARRGAWVSL